MIPRIFIKKTRYFIASLVSALSLYLIKDYNDGKKFFSHYPLISLAKAQENNAKKTREEQIAMIRQAAKGFFTNIRFADTLYNMNTLSFKDTENREHKLSEFTGKLILISLWATWCPSCRAEMPELAQLKRNMRGEDFDILTINVNTITPPEKIQKFLHDVDADNLIYYRDETTNILKNLHKQGLAFGLPTTLLIDKDGNLIASFSGTAPWSHDDAKTLIKTAIQEMR